MFDPQRLLGQMLGGSLGMGGRRGKRRKHYGTGGMVGTAGVGLGLLGVAVAAWEHYRSQETPGAARTGAPATPPPPPPPPAGARAAAPPPPPAPPASTGPGAGADAEHLLRAMIAAANADGVIDASERSAILDRARAEGADAEDLAWLERELAQPLGLDALVDATRGGLREATYAAALSAIEPDAPEERAWLAALARGLRLSDEERSAIERRLEAGEA